MTKQRFYIEGMTCAGCEYTLERAVSQLEGVCSVSADRREGTLDVEYGSPCTAASIAQAVEQTGYGISQNPPRRGDAVYLLVILLGLYLIAHHLGLLDFVRSFPTVSEQQIGSVTLFLIGLLTSVHCVAMCGGLNLAQAIQGDTRHPLYRSVLYNLGRLSSYTLIGGLLGFIGEKAAINLQIRGLIGLAAGVLMLGMGICLMGGFSLTRRRLRLPRRLARGLAAFQTHGAFAIGLVNGLMPCGPLQSMQLYAIASGSFWAGAASMFSFCLGTIPLMFLFGAAAGMLKRNWRRHILQLGSALLVLMGLFTVQNNLALSGIAIPGTGRENGAASVSSTVDGDVQYVTTTLRSNGYDDIQVVAGIPVVWTIQADEESLNGCNSEIRIPAFGQQVELKAGETIITFTPEEAGEYSYSCWMGMLRNTITVVEEESGSAAADKTLQKKTDDKILEVW